LPVENWLFLTASPNCGRLLDAITDAGAALNIQVNR
jgi:hypothetical protein